MSLATEPELQQAYRGDDVAQRYVEERFANELHGLLHQRQVAAVQEVMRRTRPARVLEIAPGPGRLTRDVQPGGKLVCLEFNEGMVHQGQKACREKAAWVRGNGFRLPFTQAFDLAYTFRFVRHFHSEDRRRLYAEIHRVLTPGGHFVMDAVNERISKPIRDADPEGYRVYDKLYQPDELRKELTEAGFEAVRLDPVQKCYRWQYQSQVFLGPRSNRLNRFVIRTLERLPVRDGLEWIVTCRRA